MSTKNRRPFGAFDKFYNLLLNIATVFFVLALIGIVSPTVAVIVIFAEFFVAVIAFDVRENDRYEAAELSRLVNQR